MKVNYHWSAADLVAQPYGTVKAWHMVCLWKKRRRSFQSKDIVVLKLFRELVGWRAEAFIWLPIVVLYWDDILVTS